VLLDALETSDAGLSRLVFFTIGGARAEEILAGVDARLRALSPEFMGTTIVYVEGRFLVADESTRLPLAEAGTDLLRKDALLAPAFEASQTQSPAYPLERCAIYDAGSRAFDVPVYLGDVRGYWEGLRALAQDGLTLADALAARWHAPDASGLDSSDALIALADERIAALR